MCKERKSVEVVADIICDGNKVFATQRGYGEWKDWWEFPGGKIEEGEGAEEALRREIREELTTDIRVGKKLTTVEWDYPKFHLTMHCFLCEVVDGRLTRGCTLAHKRAARHGEMVACRRGGGQKLPDESYEC